jgi:hypothetical protein
MGLRWSVLDPAEVQLLVYAMRIARRGLVSATTRELADTAGDRADAAAAAWFAALRVPPHQADEQRRRVFDELAAVMEVTDCTCDDPDLGRRVLRSTLADTATYLFHTVSAHTRLSRSWPVTDGNPGIADPLRRTADALVLMANDLGPRST